MRLFRKRNFGAELYRFFDRIYCINLDGRLDRWRYVNAHFARFGLKNRFERFSAIDVRTDPELMQHEKLIEDNFSVLGMCGCMLSHRGIIESAWKEKLKNVLVFEDDVRIIAENIGHIDKSLFELDRLEWEVFYLGATYLFPLHEVSPYLVNVANGAYATHAIAYGEKVFELILDTLPATPMAYMESKAFSVNAIDKWLQSDLFNHGRFYGANPIMVVQGLQESDIAFNQIDRIEQKQIRMFSRNLKR